jgi:hypothetical protein
VTSLRAQPASGLALLHRHHSTTHTSKPSKARTEEAQPETATVCTREALPASPTRGGARSRGCVPYMRATRLTPHASRLIASIDLGQARALRGHLMQRVAEARVFAAVTTDTIIRLGVAAKDA